MEERLTGDYLRLLKITENKYFDKKSFRILKFVFQLMTDQFWYRVSLEFM